MSRGIFLETPDKTKCDSTFERRYYEALRRQKLGPEIGRIAVAGLERRRYEEITSGIAEALPGIVKTDYPFELKDGKLVASDGQSIEELLLNGRENDRQIAASDNFYKPFLPQRSEHEIDEFYEQEAMANEEVSYNTLITFSPYSEEYVNSDTEEKIKKAGQKPQFKRGMLRVSHWDGERMHISTRSIDNSNVDLFRQVAKEQFGYDFIAKDSTQMLGERIRRNIQDESWKDLAGSLTSKADSILSKEFGDVRIQGRTEKEAEDLQKFVESETEIIEGLLKADKHLAQQHSVYEGYKKAFEIKVYDTIALLEKRLELGAKEKVVDYEAASSGAGAIARAEGRSYDMCGNVLSANSSMAQAANETGFESLARLANKHVQCPFCKESVVVPKAELDKGILYCTECDTGVGVCTGKRFSKGRGGAYMNGSKQPDIFEAISADLARYDQEAELKKQKEDFARQQQGHEYKQGT
jgi:hypothetical protein